MDNNYTLSSPWKERILKQTLFQEIPDILKEAVNLSAWIHQSCKSTWVAMIKELFDKAIIYVFSFTPQGCG